MPARNPAPKSVAVAEVLPAGWEPRPPIRTPFADAFGEMARKLEAELSGTIVSRRTDLFRPVPRQPMQWLLEHFPTYFQSAAGVPIPLAPHHEAFWRWLWTLRPGVPQRTFISIWARGGGKSTSTELGATAVGYFGLRRYGLYVSCAQKQADDHVANVGMALETLGVERAVNRYGFSRGWNINRLRTADGFTMDAIGMDAALRGVRIDEDRPDLIILDDLDDQLDTLDTIAKKIDVLTRKILPTGAASLTVVGVQNIPNKDGIFAQLADGRAQFLLDRQVSGPYPALRHLPDSDWYYQSYDRLTGAPRLKLIAGDPVWQGQDRAACETLLNLIGPRAFLIECQHRISLLEGELFQRAWFRVVTDWPRQARLVRFWDFASTEVQPGRKADWTVGLLVGLWQGQFWVIDMQRVRRSPKQVEDLVRQTAQVDGRHVPVWLEEEGGSSGKTVTADYRQRVLVGYSVYTWHPTGAKHDRATPVSSAAEAGNVFVVQGVWNQIFLEEVPQFGLPGVHDDIVDALSGAHYALTFGSTQLPQDMDMHQALRDTAMQGFQHRAALSPLDVTGLAGRWQVAGDWEEN